MARADGIYDETTVADLVAFLNERPAQGADLAIAADALVYLGDLRPVFAAAAAALEAGGIFAFTLESGESAFALGEGMRFRHSELHVREAAARTGFTMAYFAAVSARREAGIEVAGRAVVLTKS